MDRRMLLTRLLGIAAAIALPRPSRAAPATPHGSGTVPELPALNLTLTDTGFEIAEPLLAGRYEATVANAGTATDSHFALGKIPDRVTDAQYEEWLNSEEGE